MPASFDNAPSVVQAALVTLIGSFTDPNGGTVTASATMPSTGLLDSQLPYVWVRRGRHLNRTLNSTDLYNDVRPYQALVYVERLLDGELNDETPFDNASNWIKPFHKYLAQNDSVADAAYIRIADVRDSGDVSLFTKSSTRYAGVVFTIPVNEMTRY